MGLESASGRPGDRLMLIRTRPRHVERILDGSKTVELRRTQPSAAAGQRILIYATTPTAAIVARCRLRAVESGAPEEVWAWHRSRLGIGRRRFDAYYAGSRAAVALHLEQVELLPQPVTLQALRETRPFHPPQTWHFLSAQVVDAILGQANAVLPSLPALTVKASPA